MIRGGIIEKIAPSEEVLSEFAPWYPSESTSGEVDVIDIGEMSVVPGFVDSHTHLPWSGDRTNELAMRLRGKTYQEIAQSGGGIMKTVMHTRSTPKRHLITSGISRAQEFMRNGTTTLEAKSGYGLDLDTEIKLLESISEIDRSTTLDIRATWLGAHDFPPEMGRGEYVEHLISEQLPVISELSLARLVDVFCEQGWFTNEQTEDLVKASKDYGMKSRLHVDEFVDSGGLALAADLGSVSADHVACSNDDSRVSAAESGTVQTFLPGTPYVLGKSLELPINKCIREDWPFSIATDFNPNCPITSLPFVGSIVAHRLGVDPIASLVAATRNPATTMFDGEEPRGILSEGSIADMNVLWSSSADSWCQTPGSSPVRNTIKNGIIVNSNKTY